MTTMADLFGDDRLRRQVRVRLSRRQLFAATGISSVRRGTGHPCIVCERSIDSPTLEREVEGPGIVAVAHPDCYKLWREESALLKHRPAV
jgi:hypothetical protein